MMIILDYKAIELRIAKTMVLGQDFQRYLGGSDAVPAEMLEGLFKKGLTPSGRWSGGQPRFQYGPKR